MTLADLTKKILADAALEADRIRRDGQKSAQAAADAAVADEKSALDAAWKKEIGDAEVRAREVTEKIELDGRLADLRARREILDKFRAEFLAAVEKKSANFHEKWVAAAIKNLPEKDGEIVPLSTAFEPIVAAAWKKSGSPLRLAPAEKNGGGFVVRTGAAERDFSLGRVAREFLDGREAAIAGRIFG